MVIEKKISLSRSYILHRLIERVNIPSSNHVYCHLEFITKELFARRFFMLLVFSINPPDDTCIHYVNREKENSCNGMMYENSGITF